MRDLKRCLPAVLLLMFGAPAAAAAAQPAAALGVLDAVDAALRQSPAVVVERTEVALAGGRAMEARGALDPSIGLQASLQRLDEELSNSAKAAERKRRDELATEVGNLATQRQRADETLAETLAVAANPTGVRLSNPDHQGQLDLFNALIADAENAESRAEIERLRSEALQQRVTNARTVALDLATQEAQERERLRRLGEVPESELSHDVDVRLEWRKAFANSWTLSAFSSLSVSGFNYAGKRRDADDGGSGVLDLYRSRIGFRLDAPLGSGRHAIGRDIAAAEAEERAARWALRHRLSSVVAQVVDSYWQLAALQTRERVLRESLERQRQIALLSRALIEADLMPAVESTRLEAAVAQAEAAVAAAQRGRLAGQSALAAAIGWDAGQPLPNAADALPERWAIRHLEALRDPAYWEALSRQRADLLAILERRSAEAARLAQAGTDRGNLSTLGSELFATGVDEGSRIDQQLTGALLGTWTGPSLSLTWAFERPWHRWASEGRWRQAQAREAQAEIAGTEAARGLSRELVVLTRQLALGLDELEHRRVAVQALGSSVEGERSKLAGGTGTLLNLLLTEERRVGAVLDAVDAQYRVASGVVGLRHATASLLEGNDDGPAAVSAEALAGLDGEALVATAGMADE